MLNVGIVGCGYVCSERHIPAWRKIQGANIVAVVDMNRAQAKSVAKTYGIPMTYCGLSEMLEKERLDIVDICTPPQTHAKLAIDSMERGCDVLCEKPLSMTTKEVKEIWNCQEKTGVRFGVIHNLLFRLPIIKAHSIIKQGGLGKILGASVEMLNTKDDRMTKDMNHWSHKLAGGRFGETLSHPIYLLRHFLGDLQVESVTANKIGNYAWMPYDELHVTLRANGKVSTIYLSFNCPREVTIVNIYGEESILRVDLISSTIAMSKYIPIDAIAIGVDSLKQICQLTHSTFSNAFRTILGKCPMGHDLNIRSFVNNENSVTIKDAYEVVRVLENICRKI